jgi:hypothetical protein
VNSLACEENIGGERVRKDVEIRLVGVMVGDVGGRLRKWRGKVDGAKEEFVNSVSDLVGEIEEAE